ncbi:MAG: hypothetical protein J6Z17_01250, partial [Treponema sp.]|nr:hypothetical protein [Treponema sp.]
FKRESEITDQILHETISVYASENCTPGKYSVELTVLNSENPELKTKQTLLFNVTEAFPVIENVYPKTLNTSVSGELVLYGSGFLPGTRYFIDSAEVKCLESENENIYQKTLYISPEKLKEFSDGLHTVTAKGPNGSSSYNIEIVSPFYRISCLNDSLILRNNETAQIILKLDAFNGWKSPVKLYKKSVPENLDVTLPELVPGQFSFITASAGKKCTEGNYEIVLSSEYDDEIKIPVTVTDVKPELKLKGLSSYSVCYGETVYVFGEGFDKNVKLYSHTKDVSSEKTSLRLLKVTPSYISFKVTSALKKGINVITVMNKDETAGCFSLKVIRSAFSIVPQEREIILDKNEVNFCFNLSGCGKEISISCETLSENFTVEKSKEKYSCGEKVSVKFTRASVFSDSVSAVKIKAWNQDFYTEETLTVITCGSFEIITEKLTDPVVMCRYNFSLKANSESAVFSIVHGKLPEGLCLSEAGVISGKSLYEEKCIFTVKAVSSEGRTCEKTFSICSKRDEWFSKDKNGNYNSRSTVPALCSIKWKQSVSETIDSIVTSKNCILACTQNMLCAFDLNRNLLWKKNVSALTLFIHKNHVFIHENDKTFLCCDACSGIEYFKRKKTDRIVFDRNSVYAIENNRAFLIDADSLDVKAEFETAPENKYFVYDSKLYGFSETEVYDVSEKKTVFSSSDKIENIICVETEIYLFLQNEVICLSENFDIKERVYNHEKIKRCALDEDYIFIQSDSLLKIFTRQGLTFVKEIPVNESFIHAQEKIILYGKDGIKIINPYSCRIIWDYSRECTAVCASSGNLYAAFKNELVCFSGKENVLPPDIKDELSLTEPDGKNGWYKTSPYLTLSAEDRETYAGEMCVKINDGQWKKYDSSIELNEGKNTVKVYSVDSHGLKNEITLNPVSVDSTPPVSQIVFSAEKNDLHWFNEPLMVSVVSEDKVSGVNEIYVNKKLYTGSFAVSEEGISDISYFSTDNAGNTEEEKSVRIQCDFTSPSSAVEFIISNDFTFFKIKAFDQLSGIKRIEYSVNSSEIREYFYPVLLNTAGINEIRWRTEDNAGNLSPWQCTKKIIRSVPEKSAFVNPVFYSEDSEKKCSVSKGFSTGRNIFECSTNEVVLTAEEVPLYLSGGEYILIPEENSFNSASFYAGTDGILYLCCDSTFIIDETDGWEFEEKACISREYFSGMNCVYSKRVNEGDCVTIHFDGLNGKIPLIILKK